MIPRLVAALTALLAALPCAAQDYPSRPVRIVVPYGAGADAGRSAEYRDRVKKIFSEPATNTPAEFSAVIAAETARWGKVVRKAGVKLQD